MVKKKRKKPRKCATFICCAACTDSCEDFEGIDDTIKKNTTPNQHDETQNSPKLENCHQHKKTRRSKNRELSDQNSPTVETLDISSNQTKISKPRKNRRIEPISEIGNDLNSYNSIGFAENVISDAHRYERAIKDEHFVRGEDPPEETISVIEMEPSNLHKTRIKSLLDTLILTFNEEDYKDTTQDVVEGLLGIDTSDEDFAAENGVQVNDISVSDDEEKLVPSEHYVINTAIHEPSTKNLRDGGFDAIEEITAGEPDSSDYDNKLRPTEYCMVNMNQKDSDVMTSEDTSIRSCTESEEERPISQNDHGNMPVGMNKSVALNQENDVDNTDEVDTSSSFSAEYSGVSSSPPCDSLPDDSKTESSPGECSNANKIIIDYYKQSCLVLKSPKENQPAPMSPTQQPQSHRGTGITASKPRIRMEHNEETLAATEDGSRSISQSDHQRFGDLEQKLLESTDMESFNENGSNESSDSSAYENRNSSNQGSTNERKIPTLVPKPRDLREEMTISPGLRLTYESSSCDSANQEELPILPETSTKTKTPEERFSSLPNPFGKNPVLDTKLPNRLGSSSLVLGAIGSQNTPEKVLTPSQNRPAARRLDFSKHLMMRQDKGTAVESSAEESLQEKGLDDLLKPESMENPMKKKFSRLSESAFPTSPSIRTVETKPAWSFYDKDFTSKPSLKSGFKKEVRAKPAAAAAPRTRDLPPPQPRDDLLAPSLFGRRPGKDLPPVMGKGLSSRQPKHALSQPLSPAQTQLLQIPQHLQPVRSRYHVRLSSNVIF